MSPLWSGIARARSILCALAIVFAVTGIWLGLKLTRPKETVVVREVTVPSTGPFTLNEAKLEQLRITQRELEILGLIAAGLSNREIAGKIFVSENTVKNVPMPVTNRSVATSGPRVWLRTGEVKSESVERESSKNGPSARQQTGLGAETQPPSLLARYNIPNPRVESAVRHQQRRNSAFRQLGEQVACLRLLGEFGGPRDKRDQQLDRLGALSVFLQRDREMVDNVRIGRAE